MKSPKVSFIAMNWRFDRDHKWWQIGSHRGPNRL